MQTKGYGMYHLFIGLLALLFITACTPSETIDDRKTRLSKAHNLLVSAGEPVTFFVPPYTRLDAKFTEAEIFPASQSILHESLAGVEDALNAYPAGFVSSKIDAIFISGEMTFNGMPAGGAYKHSWIIVASTTNPSGEPNYNSALYGIHHELSSFVYHENPVTARVWASLMPENWQVKDNYIEALAINESQPIDYKNGFLNSYAQTSVENDFNTYAEFVFARADELVELAQTFPLVAKKLRLFIDAYAKQSPEM